MTRKELYNKHRWTISQTYIRFEKISKNTLPDVLTFLIDDIHTNLAINQRTTLS